jgi:hypothetical protein
MFAWELFARSYDGRFRTFWRQGTVFGGVSCNRILCSSWAVVGYNRPLAAAERGVFVN